MKAIMRNPKRSQRRTYWQGWLTTVLLFTCATVIGLVSGLDFVVLKNQRTEENKANTTGNHPLPLKSSWRAEYKQNNVCLSSECVHTASTVLSKMKQEIEPCDNFYQFACGNYLDKTQTPDDTAGVNTFPTISDEWLVQLRDILSEEQPPTEPKHRRLPNILYKACMDTTSIEKLGTKYIHQMADSFGGWPVLYGECWDRDNSWTWQDLAKKFRRIGFSTNSVVSFSIGVNLHNNTRRIIDLDQPIRALNRQYFIEGANDTFVSAYYNYMVDIAVLFGAEKEAAQKQLGEALQFEIDLASISWPDGTTGNSSNFYNLRSIKELQETYPYVEWLDYINAHLPQGLTVDENEVINLSMPNFFAELGKLLERTDKRVIANYMMWHFYGFSVNFLGDKFRKILLQYEIDSPSQPAQKLRWKKCVNVATGSLPLAVGSLYTRKYFNQQSKVITLEMVNNIRSVFSQLLDHVKWMDDKTKQEAKKKLQSMTTEIGYPDELLDEANLEEFYRKLEIDSTKYFESYLNVTVFAKDYLFAKLRMPVHTNDWIGFQNLVTANAYYSLIANSLNFPTGILQEPFFNAQRPKYMNYGAIGSIIGREITHGFDSIGHKFNGDGNLNDWWQPDTVKGYWEESKCIIEQYGNYTNKQTGLSIDGVKTQTENIADITGIKASYLAYNRWVAKNGQEPQLPGLKYTPQQMFWISAAQAWCVKYGSDTNLATDYHSPQEFRVVGAFGNTKYFACDFQCRQYTTMNPAQRCEIL